ncbi:MAG: IS110 family transposase [Candidatus Ornithospirochaeta sp.]
MRESVIYVGIDVHKDTNSVCMFDSRDNTFFAESTLDAGTDVMVKYLKKAAKDYGLSCETQFLLGYEAGPTGYGLCRGLKKHGYNCVIMAPTTIRKSSGDKVKTDRKDARLLSMTLASDGFRKVYMPDLADESTKEFTRTRNTLKKHLKKAKQNLLSFLLRVGVTYPESGNYWTEKHTEWLESVSFSDKMLQLSFDTLWQEVKDLDAKIANLDAAIEEIANSERYKDKVGKLVCFAGIQTHTALSMVCEVGDFTRFPTAEQFSSYLGLCPGQESSGKTVRYGGITKCGNSRLRLLLIEAVKGIKRSNPYSRKSKRLLLRQQGQSPAVIAYADKGSKRIKQKMTSLEKKGKAANVAATAGARELACFIWGMMNGKMD